ncbi:MAG: O-antigen ligase family protein [Deltaproteobacteria bacterium]|nr:O-antigen ligase family protein [Deltaproteobacteria bacterium]
MANPRIKVEAVKTAPAARKPVPAQGATAGDSSSWLEDLVPFGIGLLAIVLARAVTPNIRDLFQLPKQLYLADGAALLVALLGALAWMGRPFRLRTSPLVWAMFALLVAILVSLTVAPKHTGGELSLFARYDAERWLAAGAVFWVTAIGVRRPRHVWWLLTGLVAGGLVIALIGIGEQHNIQGLLPVQRWNSITKPGSTFGNRNMAAQVVVAMLPACYVALAMAVRWYLHGRAMLALWVAVPSAVALNLLLYYTMLTVTRSAWAGAALGLVAAGSAWVLGAVLAKRSPRTAEGDAVATASADPRRVGLLRTSAGALARPLAAVVVLTAGIAIVADHYKPAATTQGGDEKLHRSVPQLIKSFFEFGSDHYRWRFTMLESSWEAIKNEPLGGGAGNWRVMFPKYLVQREKNEMFTIAKQPIRAHNDFLQFGVEYGWHGLLALMVLLASALGLAVRSVARASRVEDDKAEGAALVAFAALGSLVGIVAICGDAMASFPLQLPVPTFLFCLHLGVIAAADAMLAPETAADRPTPWPQWMAAGTVAAGLGTLVFLEGFGNSEGVHGRWMIAERGFTDARNHQKQPGRAGQALVEIREAIRINPDDFQNHFIEALCLNSLGQTKEAIASLHRSLNLYPNLLNAWVNVAMFSARIKDKASMNDAIDKALVLKPDELVALNTRLSDFNADGRHQETITLVRKQVPGYQQYRASGRWPTDDGGQLVGSYKQTLNHGLTAARKLDQWQELADWSIYLDEQGIPNDGRSEESKQKEKRERAAEIAKAYRKLKACPKALPWARLAAELSRQEFADHKVQYAVTLACVGQFEDAGHEAQIGLRIDAAIRGKLVSDLEELKASGQQTAAGLDQLLAAVRPAP